MTVFCISGEVFDDDLQAWYSFLGISKYAYSAQHTLGNMSKKKLRLEKLRSYVITRPGNC